MAKLVASTFVENGTLSVYLDNRVIIQNNDSVTVTLRVEEEYIVHWFAEGTPGTSYSISISSPQNAQVQLTRLLGPGGKAIGHIQFNT